MLSIYGHSVRVSLKLEASRDFFLRRIEWRPKQIVLIHLLGLENTISSEKKNEETKKP